MSTIKDRNGLNTTEAEDIKMRWQEYKTYTKKFLITQMTTAVWSHHLEPDNLECGVKWALGSIAMNKASGGDGMPVELFQIQKMML